MPEIVQFTHPGGEHHPDKGSNFYKSWNFDGHKRKFMCCNGDYVSSSGDVLNDDLLFWGEWEPPSKIKKFCYHPDSYHPQFLHYPIFPNQIPDKNTGGRDYQNTDPYVFGDRFKYFVCKQFKPKTGKETSLAKLEKGSLILFGSTSGRVRESSFFMLDTVFVVSDYIKYDPSEKGALDRFQDEAYRNISFNMMFPRQYCKSLKLRLYLGATYENKINGMYSFVPSRRAGETKKGFPRAVLKDMEFITNNLNASPKISRADSQGVSDFWNKIRSVVREQNYVEGVRFNLFHSWQGITT